jgi:hypothetical protein
MPQAQMDSPSQVPPTHSRSDQQPSGLGATHLPLKHVRDSLQSPSSRQQSASFGTHVPGSSDPSQSAVHGQTHMPEQTSSFPH